MVSRHPSRLFLRSLAFRTASGIFLSLSLRQHSHTSLRPALSCSSRPGAGGPTPRQPDMRHHRSGITPLSGTSLHQRSTKAGLGNLLCWPVPQPQEFQEA